MAHDGSTDQRDHDQQDSYADTQADGESEDARLDTRLYKKVRAFNEFIDVSAQGLSPAESLVWLVLFRFARDGSAMASKATIAKRAGVSEKTVARSITKLESLGLLKIICHGGKEHGSNRYRLGIVSLEPKPKRPAAGSKAPQDPSASDIAAKTPEPLGDDQPAGNSKPRLKPKPR